MQDYSDELRDLFNKYKNRGFEYGKPVDYLEFRNGCSIEEMERELLEFKDLKFVERQLRDGDKRYKTYHIYSNSKGRVYVVTFTSKIRIITIYPLGESTTKRYRKAKLKKVV